MSPRPGAGTCKPSVRHTVSVVKEMAAVDESESLRAAYAFLYGDAMPPAVDADVEDQLDVTAKRHLEKMMRRRYRAYVVAEMAHTSRRPSEKGPVAAAITSFLYQQPGLNGPGASDKLWEIFAVDLGLAKSKSHFVTSVQALIDVCTRILRACSLRLPHAPVDMTPPLAPPGSHCTPIKPPRLHQCRVQQL